MTCPAWLVRLVYGCLTMCDVVCRARMHTWAPTCMVAPGHAAMLGGGARIRLLLGLLQCRNSPNALRRRDHVKAARPSGCSLSLRRTHSEPCPAPCSSIQRNPWAEDRFHDNAWLGCKTPAFVRDVCLRMRARAVWYSNYVRIHDLSQVTPIPYNRTHEVGYLSGIAP